MKVVLQINKQNFTNKLKVDTPYNCPPEGFLHIYGGCTRLEIKTVDYIEYHRHTGDNVQEITYFVPVTWLKYRKTNKI